MTVQGKRVLVLGGGGSGIGRAVTRAFGRGGASVAVADLDAGRAAEAADELRAGDVPAGSLSGDVRSLEDLRAMVAGAVELLGGLDVLVTVVGGQVAFVPTVRLHETRTGTPCTSSTSGTSRARCGWPCRSSSTREAAARSSASAP